MTSDESHLKLQGYFSGLVDKAKAQDDYDEKTQVEIKARAVQRLEQEAKKAQAASNAAAELLKPGGQSLVEYPARAPPQPQPAGAGVPMGVQPLPQGYVLGPQGYVQNPNGVVGGQQQVYSAPYGAPAQVLAKGQAAVPAPAPAPQATQPSAPPAFSNAFNSFLAQVNQQAGAQLQQK